MGIRIYLGSRYDNRCNMRHWKNQLEDIGCEVVSTWHDAPDAPDERGGPKWSEVAREAGDQCLREIDRCDVLLADFTVGMEDAGGSVYTEMGYALANGSLVWRVGDGAYRNIFMFVDAVRPFETLDGVIHALVEGGDDQ